MKQPMLCLQYICCASILSLVATLFPFVKGMYGREWVGGLGFYACVLQVTVFVNCPPPLTKDLNRGGLFQLVQGMM